MKIARQSNSISYSQKLSTKIDGLDKDQSSYRTTIDRLLTDIVGSADSNIVCELKYCMTKLEEHSMRRLAQLNRQLLQNSDLHLQLAAMSNLVETLNYKFLRILKAAGTGLAGVSQLYAAFQDIHKLFDDLNVKTRSSQKQLTGIRASEKLVLQKMRFELSVKEELKCNKHEKYSDRQDNQCKLRTKRLSDKNIQLVQEICALSKQLELRNKKIEECLYCITLLRQQLSKYQLCESESSIESSNSKRLIVQEDQELLNRIQTVVSQAVEKAVKVAQQPPEIIQTRERVFTLNNWQVEDTAEEQSARINQTIHQPFEQKLFYINDGELLQMILTQASTIEQFLQMSSVKNRLQNRFN